MHLNRNHTPLGGYKWEASLGKSQGVRVPFFLELMHVYSITFLRKFEFSVVDIIQHCLKCQPNSSSIE